MKLFDFGKNTYSIGIQFRFDCISQEMVTALANRLVIEKQHFSELGKDDNTGQTVFAQGDGTEKAPYFQLRADEGQVLLWAGWHVGHDDYLRWRGSLLPEVVAGLRGIAPRMVATIATQTVVTVPDDHVKEPSMVPETEAIRAFFKRYIGIPDSFLKRSRSSVLFADEQGRSIEYSIGGIPGETAITHTVRAHQLDAGLSLADNVLAHANFSDQMLQGFNDGFLKLIIKT